MSPRDESNAARGSFSATPVEATKRCRRMVETPHGHLHVATAGAGGTPLLLLHMSPLSGRMWDTVLPRLARDRLVVVPDRLGFGCSDHLAAPIPFSDYASATVRALDVLGLECVDVVGIHTGSCEAVELATAHAERVRRVAVVALPDLTDEERATFKARFGPLPEPVPDGSHLAELWSWWHDADRVLARSAELIQARLLDHLISAPHTWWTYHAVFDYPFGERLRQVRQPLIAFGPHDDLWEQTRRTVALLPPHADFVDLPHLGYEIFTLAADEMAGRLIDFLDAGEQA